jgi:phosphate starvation-inducible protein PhoH and related proteins
LMAFEHVLSESTPAERVIVMRSAVPTREIGFMPGTKEEKEEPFMAPYKGLCKELFRDDGQAYHKMLKNGQLVFETTSFIRGQTFNNAVIVVDEMQNLNFHELDSVITRAGKNTRLIFSGDYYQSDFVKSTDKMGLYKFIEILDHMAGFEQVQFKWTDIIRSDLVRDYIMTKEMLGFR